MSKTINIYGDSFGASTSSDSWVNLLKQQYTVNNFCSNGTSEYRIYKTLKNTYKEEVDIYIIVHTSPYRVYIANNIFYKTRFFIIKDVVFIKYLISINSLLTQFNHNIFH